MLNKGVRITPPLTDRQGVAPVRLCGRCGGEVYPGESVYRWEDRELCPDCFRSRVAAWLEEATDEVARALSVEQELLVGGGCIDA